MKARLEMVSVAGGMYIARVINELGAVEYEDERAGSWNWHVHNISAIFGDSIDYPQVPQGDNDDA